MLFRSLPQGGVKVLITGPWTEAMHRYTCMFDHSTVPASLIQPGVLRCYCPGEAARPRARWQTPFGIRGQYCVATRLRQYIPLTLGGSAAQKFHSSVS